ncbi:tetratricopeptide repeat protein [Ferrovibrio xuzhouensis]|uniref:Tetratricopeptide repeat protein n=1 Tax=Ferrovibrio xuzhouensis TaxID=1576914 RepID=A0ABV7VJQ4_9PROT
MADFIDEVDEEVRRERMQSLWKRWSPLIIAAVILLLAAVGGWQFWQNYRADRAAAASAAFTAALNEAQAGKPLDAAKSFGELAGTAGGGYAVLSRFQQAANLIEGKDVAGAIKAYDAIAADSAVDGRLRDLARYLAVAHGLDTLAPADAKQRLDAVSAGSPWAASVTELKALVALKAGDRDAARKLLTGLADDAVAPAGLRGRAAEMLAALGGPVQQ